MADLRKYVAVKPTRIVSGISAIATSVVVAALEDINGNTITMSDLGNEAYGVFEPKSSSKREIFKVTGISGTTMTVQRGGSAKSPYTFSGTGETHGASTQVVFYTNAPQLYDTFANKYNDETIVGDWTFDADNPPQYDANPAFGSGTHEFATVKFVEDTANAGAANGSTTVKGLFEEATQAEIDAATAAGGTSARLAVNPSTLATSIYGTRLPSAGQKTLLDGITADATEINKLDGYTGTTADLNEASAIVQATNITGAELETLSSGASSNADTLHTHSSLKPIFLSTFTWADNTSGAPGRFTAGFVDGTSKQTLIGQGLGGDSDVFYGRLWKSVDGSVFVSDVNSFDPLALQADTDSFCGALVVGSTIIYAKDDGGVLEIWKEGTGQYTISGTAPTNATYGMLGFDPTNNYLLVWDTSTTIHRYSGYTTGTLTYVDEITVPVAIVNTGGLGTYPSFCFDDTNDYYIYPDFTNSVIRRVSAAGATVDTYDYTAKLGTSRPYGVEIIGSTVYMIVPAVATSATDNGITEVARIATTLTV